MIPLGFVTSIELRGGLRFSHCISSGWIVKLSVITSNVGAGVIMIIIAFLLTGLAVVDMIVLIRVGGTRPSKRGVSLSSPQGTNNT